MFLSPFSDPWTSVLDTDGRDRLIAPWQMADRAISRLNWSRTDLNLACLALLIGPVFMADPPRNDEDWGATKPRPRVSARPARPFALAINLPGGAP